MIPNQEDHKEAEILRIHEYHLNSPTVWLRNLVRPTRVISHGLLRASALIGGFNSLPPRDRLTILAHVSTIAFLEEEPVCRELIWGMCNAHLNHLNSQTPQYGRDEALKLLVRCSFWITFDVPPNERASATASAGISCTLHSYDGGVPTLVRRQWRMASVLRQVD